MTDPVDDPDVLLERLSKPEPRPAVQQAVRRECAASLRPQRCLSRRMRFVVCGGLLLFLIAVLGLLALLANGAGMWRAALWGTAGWAIVLLTVLLIGVAPKRSRSCWWRRALLIGMPAAFFAYLAISHGNMIPLHTFVASEPLVGHALRCGMIAMLIGAFGSAGVLYIWRGSDPFSPRLSGALIGLMGGIAGALSIGVVCPGQNAWHVLLGHGLSVVGVGLLGLLVGRRILSP